MIFIDIDGTLIDFIGTARKFGIEMDPSMFGQWKWGADGYPTPEEFYKKAELQPWAKELTNVLSDSFFPDLITADYADIKKSFLTKKSFHVLFCDHFESRDKSIYCKTPMDFLIDDDPSQCEAWRRKGGIAYHFDLSDYYKNGADPFKKFLEYWRLEK